MVNHHFSPPFGRISFTFSRHRLQQFQDLQGCNFLCFFLFSSYQKTKINDPLRDIMFIVLPGRYGTFAYFLSKMFVEVLWGGRSCVDTFVGSGFS